MATFGVLSSATKNTERAKATQVALDRAQQEVEKLRTLTNDGTGDDQSPRFVDHELNPGYRVNASNSTYALNRSPRGSYQPMVINERTSLYGGGVGRRRRRQPGTDPLLERRRARRGLPLRGLAQRRKMPRNLLSGDPGLQADRRRREARHTARTRRANAVTSKSSRNSSTPRTAPKKTRTRRRRSRHGAAVLPQRHGLLRRRRNRSRRNRGGSSPAQHHGDMRRGLQNGTTPGAPDTLLLGGPPDPAPEDESNPLRYDYSNDFYLEPTPDTDEGSSSGRTTPAAATPRRRGRRTPRRRSTAGSPTRWPPNSNSAAR